MRIVQVPEFVPDTSPPPANHRVVELDTVRAERSIERDDFLAQFRSALVAIYRQMTAERCGPHHLERIHIAVDDLDRVDHDSIETEVAYREILGGNFPTMTLSEGVSDSHAGLDIFATAFVPTSDTHPPVYRGYTGPDLNRLYSARLAVPEHLEIFERWRHQGEAMDDRVSEQMQYGASPWEVLDFMRPAGTESAPLHLFLHGGYWQSLDKVDSRFFTRALLDAGCAVAVVNYDLCPNVGLDIVTEQVRRACVYLYQRCDDLGIDQSRIQAGGHSAGAHLAAELISTPWRSRDRNLPDDLIRCGVLVSGIYDLMPLRFTGLNRALQLDNDGAFRNSPLHRTPPPGCDLVIAWGGEESEEFERQSRDFASVWSQHGARVTLCPVEEANHFTVIETLADPQSTLFREAMRQLSLPK